MGIHITGRIKAHSSNSGMRVTGTVVAVNAGGYTFNLYPNTAVESSTSTGSLAGMTMVFNHEFDGDPILINDGGKFNPYFIYFGGSAQPDSDPGFRWWGDELQVYATSAYTAAPFNPYSISGSTLTILGIPKSSTWTTTQPYVSGCLETSDSHWWESADVRAAHGGFEQKYGYWEIRAKIPVNNKGIWCAFWLAGGILSGVGGEHQGEIDIFETIGDGKIYHTLHDWWTPTTYAQQHTILSPSAGFAASSTFHVYGLLWTPSRITWYIDGVETMSASAGYVALYNNNCGPLYININQAIGGSWPGSPDGTTTFPSRLEIDYIRAYTID